MTISWVADFSTQACLNLIILLFIRIFLRGSTAVEEQCDTFRASYKFNNHAGEAFKSRKDLKASINSALIFALSKKYCRRAPISLLACLISAVSSSFTYLRSNLQSSKLIRWNSPQSLVCKKICPRRYLALFNSDGWQKNRMTYKSWWELSRNAAFILLSRATRAIKKSAHMPLSSFDLNSSTRRPSKYFNKSVEASVYFSLGSFCILIKANHTLRCLRKWYRALNLTYG